MISPLQNLKTLMALEHQLIANLIQNSAPAPEQMQQTAGQTGTADNSARTPPLPCPSPTLVRRSLLSADEGGRGEGKKETGLLDSADSSAQTIKETGNFLPITQKDQPRSLKEQIVSLSQTLVQQGHLPTSTLNQPIPVIVPQMLACLGKLHREEKKKKQKKKKKADDSSEKNDSPADLLLAHIFGMTEGE